MKLTKKYKADVEKAWRCAEKGEAYHWPTIAAILADEIKRLRRERDSTLVVCPICSGEGCSFCVVENEDITE